jgi:hypothetical protein
MFCSKNGPTYPFMKDSFNGPSKSKTILKKLMKKLTKNKRQELRKISNLVKLWWHIRLLHLQITNLAQKPQQLLSIIKPILKLLIKNRLMKCGYHNLWRMKNKNMSLSALWLLLILVDFLINFSKCLKE